MSAAHVKTSEMRDDVHTRAESLPRCERLFAVAGGDTDWFA